METDWLWDVAAAQERVFALECTPMFREALASFWDTGRAAEVLDVGCARGAGTALLAHVYGVHSGSRLKIRITGIDQELPHLQWSQSKFPGVKLVEASAEVWAQTHQAGYDLVFSSHVIEHTPVPAQFFQVLKSMSRGPVVLACPFEEAEPMIPGHISRITQPLLNSLGVKQCTVYRSAGFGGRCVVARF